MSEIASSFGRKLPLRRIAPSVQKSTENVVHEVPPARIDPLSEPVCSKRTHRHRPRSQTTQWERPTAAAAPPHNAVDETKAAPSAAPVSTNEVKSQSERRARSSPSTDGSSHENLPPGTRQPGKEGEDDCGGFFVGVVASFPGLVCTPT